MCPASPPQVTELLAKWGRGDAGAREALIPLVYEELRRIAHRQLWRQRADHTLQSAALVNEAYLRLVHQQSPQWQNRPHFFGVAAQLMRNILVDYARSRLAAKRGAGARQTALVRRWPCPKAKKSKPWTREAGFCQHFRRQAAGHLALRLGTRRPDSRNPSARALHSKSWLRRCKLVE